jgi:hypothetical protein
MDAIVAPSVPAKKVHFSPTVHATINLQCGNGEDRLHNPARPRDRITVNPAPYSDRAGLSVEQTTAANRAKYEDYRIEFWGRCNVSQY